MNLVQTQEGRDLLAEALGDTPETVIPAGLLLAGLADAYVAGEAPRFEGVVVQSHLLRREPWCFGCDASAVWGLLRPLNDWGRKAMSPNLSAELARPVAALIEQETGVKVRYYGDVDVYHTLAGRVNGLDVPEVRLLDLEDVNLLSAYWGGSRAMGFATYEDLLTDGAVAGAVVEGRLVALAHTNAMTAKLWRYRRGDRRGLAWTGLRLRGRVPRSAPGSRSGGGPRCGARVKATRRRCAWRRSWGLWRSRGAYS